MSRWKLTIELQSGLAAGSGVGSPGDVDRDIVHDEYGLPYLPGKRIKGLLRDAYRDVADTGIYSDLPDVDEVFGKTGNIASGPIDFGDAHIGHYEIIRSWLAGKPPQIHVRDVVNAYSHRVRQTAMDPTRGAPLENTLRATRLLNAGITFTSYLTVDSDEGKKWFKHLERAAGALQLAGIARTRGWGELKCTLSEVTEIDAEKENTRAAAEDICRGEVAQAQVLRYCLETKRPVLAPSRTSDPNTVRSEDYLPGSLLVGVCAQRLKGDAASIHRLLLADDVQFLPAYPVNVEGEVTEPLPHSLRAFKSEENRHLDLAEAENVDQPLRRLRGWPQAGALVQGSIRLHEVSWILNYHHSRAANRRIGRAVGEEASKYRLDRAKAGELFVYEAIAARQTFEGEIHGPAEKLAEIRELLDQERTGITLGRSRNAQYGGEATLTWCDPSEGSPVDGSASSFGDKIVVTLLSDLVNVNEDGHLMAVFPEETLAKSLGVTLKPEKSFTRHAWCAGYLSHQRLPRQQALCLRAGSVFVFAADSVVTGKILQEAEKRSYGLRTNEGFGRIRLAFFGWSDPSVSREGPFSKAAAIESSHPAYSIALRLYRQRVRQKAIEKGREEAYRLLGLKSEADTITKFSASLLQRLNAIFESGTLKRAAGQLEKLRDSAQKPLRRVWLTPPESERQSEYNLHQYFVNLCDTSPFNPTETDTPARQGSFGTVCAARIEHAVWARSSEGWTKVFKEKPESLPAEELVKLFVHSLLRSLMIEKRKVRETQPQEKGGAK